LRRSPGQPRLRAAHALLRRPRKRRPSETGHWTDRRRRFLSAHGLCPTTRGSDEKLWRDAVRAFETALKRDDKLILAHANLGLAHLVHANDERAENLAKALEHFQKASEFKGRGLEGLDLSAVLINHGVALQAAGQSSIAENLYAEAANALQMARDSQALARVRLQHDAALCFNQSVIAAARGQIDDTKSAAELLERYLTEANVDSLWYPLALKRYEAIAGNLTLKASDFAKRKSEVALRPISNVVVPALPASITLSESTNDTLKHLGQETATGTPLAKFLKIRRYTSVAPGIDLLADDSVLAIFLVNDQAPPVIVQGQGVGAVRSEVRVGMPAAEFFNLLDRKSAEVRSIDRRPAEYLFFPDIGLSVRVENGQIAELVVAQMPRAKPR